MTAVYPYLEPDTRDQTARPLSVGSLFSGEQLLSAFSGYMRANTKQDAMRRTP